MSDSCEYHTAKVFLPCRHRLRLLSHNLWWWETFRQLRHGTGLDSGVDGHGFLDSRVLSVFITAFGGFGAIGIQMGLGIVTSSFIGLAGGVVLGGLVSLFARFLYKQQSSSSVTTAQLVGRTAQVIVSIQANNLGQVSCRIGEERVEKLARSKEGRN